MVKCERIRLKPDRIDPVNNNNSLPWIALRLVGAAAALLILQLSPVPGLMRAASVASQAAESDGDYRTAAMYVAPALNRYPWSDEGWSRFAYLSLQAGDYEAAHDSYQRVADLRPLTALEYGYRGAASDGLGNREGALVDWETARQLGGLDAASLNQLISIYLDRQQWDEAIAALDLLTASEPNPGTFTLHAYLKALYQPGDALPALIDAGQMAVDSERPTLLALAALVEQVETLGLEVYYTRLGLLMFDAGKLAYAEAALEQAVRAAPDAVLSLAYLGYVRDRLGGDGLDEVMQARSLDPANPTAAYLAGVVWSGRGRPYEARAAFRDAAMLDPTNPAFAVEIANTYAATENWQAGEAWIAQSVEVAEANGADSTSFRALQARFYLENGYRIEERGLPLAEALVMDVPGSAEAHDALGLAYFLVGNSDQAVVQFDLALRLDPGLAAAHYHRGRAMEALGDFSVALWHYQQAVALEPTSRYGVSARHAVEDLTGSE